MTRMLFIHPSDEMYGADRMLLEFLDALPPGVEPTVWLPTDLAHPEHPLCHELHRAGVRAEHVDLPILRRAYRTPPALLRLLRRMVRLRATVRAAAPDVVYCTTSTAFLCAPAARSAGVRRVIGHVQEIWTCSDRLVLGILARACSQLLAISGAVAESAGGRLRSRIRVVPNGVAAPGTCEPLAERTGPLNFLVASRWNAWKGHRTLLRAWDMAQTDATLTVVGGPPGIGESVDVPALRDALARPDSVRIVGEVASIGPYLGAADVVVVPSDRPEPFGLVAIEAFACGRPVLASAAGGLLDIVSDGKDGWLFPPQDAAALARAIEKRTRDEVVVAGELGREKFLETYTSKHFGERWRRAADL